MTCTVRLGGPLRCGEPAVSVIRQEGARIKIELYRCAEHHRTDPRGVLLETEAP